MALSFHLKLLLQVSNSRRQQHLALVPGLQLGHGRRVLALKTLQNVLVISSFRPLGWRRCLLLGVAQLLHSDV